MSAAANSVDRTFRLFHQGPGSGRSGGLRQHPGRTEPPARQDRADRLREHRLQGGAGSPGLGADQQVCRRLSRQALLWRLRICRRHRTAGDRPRLQAVRLPAYANVQPHSGANANQAVFYALLQPGDTFMGLDLAAGGHLTHGHPANYSGKWFKPVPYTVRRDDQRIDMDQVAALAREHKPKLIMAGGSRLCPHHRLRAPSARSPTRSAPIFMVDMAHFAGLVAGGVHPNPIAACPCGDHHHPQDPARPARRHDPVQRRAIWARRSTPPSSPACRAAPDACHRRQGGGVRRGAEAGIQDLCEECGGECQGAGRSAQVQRAWTSSPAAPTPI